MNARRTSHPCRRIAASGSPPGTRPQNVCSSQHLTMAMASVCASLATSARLVASRGVGGGMRRGVASGARVQRAAVMEGGGGAGVTAGEMTTNEAEAEEMTRQQTLQEVTRKLKDCRRRKAAANAVDLLVGLGRAGRAFLTCIRFSCRRPAVPEATRLIPTAEGFTFQLVCRQLSRHTCQHV